MPFEPASPTPDGRLPPELEDASPLTRDDLIISLAPVVKICARRILRTWPGIEEMDELVADGWIGAIDAVDRYDAAYGASLKNYGYIRIRGQMIDGMRFRRGRQYVDDRIDPKFEGRRHQVSLDKVVHSTAAGSPHGERAGVTIGDMIMDDDDAMARAIDVLIIQEALPFLPERDQSVLRRYYWEGISLKEIGAQDGLTESRICQMAAVARDRMYRVLTDDGAQASLFG